MLAENCSWKSILDIGDKHCLKGLSDNATTASLCSETHYSPPQRFYIKLSTAYIRCVSKALHCKISLVAGLNWGETKESTTYYPQFLPMENQQRAVPCKLSWAELYRVAEMKQMSWNKRVPVLRLEMFSAHANVSSSHFMPAGIFALTLYAITIKCLLANYSISNLCDYQTALLFCL